MDNALVLLSGGQDSGTCLFWAKKNFSQVSALAFDYGQKHKVELECARNLAEIANCKLTVLKIENLLSNSSLTEHEKSMSETHEKDSSLPSSFVPGRNALFLNLASINAYNNDIENIVIGACQTDYSGYPDCRQEFIESYQKTISLALGKELKIHTPLMYLTKAETWKLANDLSVLDIIINKTHTDYNGDHETLNEWGYGKLDNPASELRAKGFFEAKEKGWV